MISFNKVIAKKVQRLDENRTFIIREMGNNLIFMKYIVYLTTNKVNNKIYIGVHETENPEIFDGYLGNGAYVNKPSSYNKGKYHLHNAILKYGVSSFHRKTLKVFDNLQDALDLEAWLVTKEFVSRSDTYNMTVGGQIPPTQIKCVYQFDLKGTLIKKWESIKSITDYYNCNKDQIRICINEKRSFKSSYWSDEEVINLSEYRISTHGKVFQYTASGEFLNSFEDVKEASIKLDLDRQAITNAVYNRTVYSGYYFLRESEDINQLLKDKSGKILKSTIPVHRYTISGVYDRSYKSIAEAVRDNNKTSWQSIKKAIKNETEYAGYRWSYDKYPTIQKYRELKPVKIAQYDLSGNLIKIWDSVSECKKEFPSCQRVCRKERRSTKGYVFEYIS